MRRQKKAKKARALFCPLCPLCPLMPSQALFSPLICSYPTAFDNSFPLHIIMAYKCLATWRSSDRPATAGQREPICGRTKPTAFVAPETPNRAIPFQAYPHALHLRPQRSSVLKLTCAATRSRRRPSATTLPICAPWRAGIRTASPVQTIYRLPIFAHTARTSATKPTTRPRRSTDGCNLCAFLDDFCMRRAKSRRIRRAISRSFATATRAHPRRAHLTAPRSRVCSRRRAPRVPCSPRAISPSCS